MRTPPSTRARPLAYVLPLVLLGASANFAQAQVEQAPVYEPVPNGDGMPDADAQPASDPYAAPAPATAASAKPIREGFLLGLSLGFGTVDFGPESETSLNYQVELGGFVTPEWAVSVGAWGTEYGDEFTTVTNTNWGVMAQHWFQDKFWFQGAIGTAHLSSERDGFPLYDIEGMAVGGRLGWDFYDFSKNYHMNLNAGLTIEGYEEASDNLIATALQLALLYY